jgi:NAD-dependent deacetylase
MTAPDVIDPRLLALLQDARSILVFSGAGISTSSGIPDFRGPGGVWTRRQPVYYDAFLASEAARVEYWDYKLETWDLHQRAEPNAVHHAVVALERAGKIASVVTQNVDGLHRRAGTSPGRLVEMHGTDLLVECQTCHATSDPGPHFERFKATRRPPHCACGGLLKSATISFGQSLRSADLNRGRRGRPQISLALTTRVNPAARSRCWPAERGTPYVIVNRGADHDGACMRRFDWKAT